MADRGGDRDGRVTSLIAAVIPARAAAQVDPVKALQKGRYQSLKRRRKPLAAALGDRVRGGVGDGAAVHIGHDSRYTLIFYGGYLLAVLAAVLLAPALALWLARALRPVLAWMRPVEGTLAADSLIPSAAANFGHGGGADVSLALVISLGGLARASYDSIDGCGCASR